MKIFKIIIVCLVITLCYNVILLHIKPNWGEPSQSQRNLIRIQNFYDSDSLFQTIIVGSSKAAKISTPPNSFNLSIENGSQFTGLEIIKRSGKFPKVLLIETNIIDRNIDYELIDRVIYPGAKFLRNNIVSFKEKYKPSLLISSIIFYQFKLKNILMVINNAFFHSNESINIKSDLAKIIKAENEKMNITFSSQYITKRIKMIEENVIFFNKINTQSYIFTMPPENHYFEEFDFFKFNTIRIPYDIQAYLAPDGNHLDVESSKKYSVYLFNEINKFGYK